MESQVITLDFFKKLVYENISGIIDLKDIINQYEIERDAEAEEFVIDITNVEDYKTLVDRYGIDVASEVYMDYRAKDDGSRYYLIGNNFEMPREITNIKQTLKDMWDDIFDSIMANPLAYEKYIVMPRLVADICGQLFNDYKPY